MLQTFLPSRRRDCLTSALCPIPTFPKPHYPLLCTITLASLVKGRWIDGKAQVLILLLSACDMPIIFMLQTFSVKTEGLPHLRPLPHTNPSKTALSLALHYHTCLPSKKGRWHGCRGFSTCCTVFR